MSLNLKMEIKSHKNVLCYLRCQHRNEVFLISLIIKTVINIFYTSIILFFNMIVLY